MNHNDQEFLAQKIRAQYVEKQNIELDALKALDAKVKRPVNIFAYTFGSLGALVMGAGMSLVMTELGALMGQLALVIGILVGLLGVTLIALAYPAYNRTLLKQRQRIAPEILRLTEELLR